MYKLIYKSQFVTGFDEDQILGNLAQLLQLKPKAIRLMFLSGRPSVIKVLDSEVEMERWRAAFLEAGVHLDVVNIAAPDADSIADQIELELELHSLDEDFDEEEPPRQLLVKKIIAQEEVANIIPDAFEPAIVAPTVRVEEKALSQESPLIETPVTQVENVGGKKSATKKVLSNKKAEEKLAATSVQAESGAVDAAPILFGAIADSEPQTKETAADDNKFYFENEGVAQTDPELDAKDHQDDAPLDEEYVDVNWHKSSFLWGMLIILLAIFFTAATILWLKQPLWAPANTPAQADKVVTALATESLSALAYIDVKRLQQLPEVLQKNTGMKNLPAPDANFWPSLERAGVDISRQIEQMWVAGYKANNRTHSLWVLNGKFNPEQIRAWLKKNYLIDGESPHQIIFSATDNNTCEKKSMMAVIEPDRILIGAPEYVAAFGGRLDAAAPAGRDLSDWQRISAGQMLTVALFNPAQSNNNLTTTALTKLSINAAPVKGIYIGLAPRLLPPVLEFSAVLVGSEEQYINATKDSIAQVVSNAKKTIVKDWPETLPLYERIKLSQSGQQLHATLFFDEQVQQQLQLLGQSLFASAPPVNAGAPVAILERLEEKLPEFNDLPSFKIPEFAQSQHLNTAIVAQTSVGPFGVGISSIQSTTQGIAISLDVNAFNLPNLGKDADAIQLRVTDIVDHQDKSLIANVGCSPNGMHEVAAINSVYEGAFFEEGQSKSYVGIQGTKKILLPENINLSSVGAIKGEIEYRLPTKLERMIVKAPLAGKLISSNGLQLRFLSADAGTLYFQQDGNSDALVQINVLNADSKALAVINTQHEKNVLGLGSTTRIDVQGKVAAVEIVVASKLEKKLYPFSFGRIQPPEKTFEVEKPAPELLSAEKLKLLKQDAPPADVKYPYQTPQQTTVAGPALIAINQLNIVEQKLSLGADIYLRDQHPLSRQLSAVRLVITEVEDSSGNLHSVNIQVPVSPEHQGGSWGAEGYLPDPAQPWLRGQLELREQALGVSDAVALWGKLVFLAPGEPITIPIPFQFGMEWNGSGSSLKLSRWEAGSLLFDIQGSFSELMAITALDAEGAVISQAAELRNNLGVSQVELPVKQRPASIEFSIARDQQTAEFPFEIRAVQ